MLFSVYYVNDQDRVKAIQTFSINRKFKWAEQGIAMASWTYQKIADVEKPTIREVKKLFSELQFDRKRKTFQRTINIGDIVVCGNGVYVYTPVGWLRVPQVLWQKANKVL